MILKKILEKMSHTSCVLAVKSVLTMLFTAKKHAYNKRCSYDPLTPSIQYRQNGPGTCVCRNYINLTIDTNCHFLDLVYYTLFLFSIVLLYTFFSQEYYYILSFLKSIIIYFLFSRVLLYTFFSQEYYYILSFLKSIIIYFLFSRVLLYTFFSQEYYYILSFLNSIIIYFLFSRVLLYTFFSQEYYYILSFLKSIIIYFLFSIVLLYTFFSQ